MHGPFWTGRRGNDSYGRYWYERLVQVVHMELPLEKECVGGDENCGKLRDSTYIVGTVFRGSFLELIWTQVCFKLRGWNVNMSHLKILL